MMRSFPLPIMSLDGFVVTAGLKLSEGFPAAFFSERTCVVLFVSEMFGRVHQ